MVIKLNDIKSVTMKGKDILDEIGNIPRANQNVSYIFNQGDIRRVVAMMVKS